MPANAKILLKNSIDPTYLDQNINDGVVNSAGDAVTIQKVVLVDSSSNPVADINDANPLVVSMGTNAQLTAIKASLNSILAELVLIYGTGVASL
jgi:hypothetical protein